MYIYFRFVYCFFPFIHQFYSSLFNILFDIIIDDWYPDESPNSKSKGKRTTRQSFNKSSEEPLQLVPSIFGNDLDEDLVFEKHDVTIEFGKDGEEDDQDEEGELRAMDKQEPDEPLEQEIGKYKTKVVGIRYYTGVVMYYQFLKNIYI